jgi:hypothetical protein
VKAGGKSVYEQPTHRGILRRILGLHSGGYEEFCLLGNDAM